MGVDPPIVTFFFAQKKFYLVWISSQWRPNTENARPEPDFTRSQGQMPDHCFNWIERPKSSALSRL